jgi:hypothetical protein
VLADVLGGLVEALEHLFLRADVRLRRALGPWAV